MIDQSKTSESLGSVFIGHGSPMNIIADNVFTQNIKRIGQGLPKPKTIICVSAHWVTRGTLIVSSEKPKQIYDFYGFPKELYDYKYSPVGNPEFARNLTIASQGKVIAEDSWGLDHGSWSVLCHMYPQQDISCLQLSMNQALNPLEHFKLAVEIKNWVGSDVLFLGSGNIVHNLKEANMQDVALAHPWAEEFETFVLDILTNKELKSEDKIKEIFTSKKLAKAHPTIEHLIPLVYSMGFANSNHAEVMIKGIQNASISMATVKF